MCPLATGWCPLPTAQGAWGHSVCACVAIGCRHSGVVWGRPTNVLGNALGMRAWLMGGLVGLLLG